MQRIWYKHISLAIICICLGIISLLVPGLLPLSGSGCCHAVDNEALRKEEQRKIKERIHENQIKIQRLQAGLENQQEGVEKTKEQEKGVLAEIEELDTKLLEMAQRLEDLNNRMAEQQILIATKEEELGVVREKSNKVQLHMQKRIGAYYKLGKIDLLNITFSTRTLPELLRFHDSFQAVIEYDQHVMQSYRDGIEELERAREALTLERGLLEEFISQINDKKENINGARKEKAVLLNRVKTQTALHEQAIKELAEAKAALASSLLAMKKKERLFDQGFLLNKGDHIAPASGEISSLFNQEIINQFGITRKNPGISIDAADGVKIRAIYEGKVIYSGYLKGYGNTIIINHGYDYYTITSRIERLLVRKGTKVKRNDIIGIMGSTATILDDGLYFEIRLKDEPLDPIAWLNNDRLTFAKGLLP